MAVRVDIRPYAEGDRPETVALWRTCGLVVPWNDPDRDIDVRLATADGLFLVAVRDGRIVGTAMGGDDGHRGWVYYMAVAPDLQRHGIGRALMDAIEERLRRRGCQKLNLMVRGTNPKAIGFYRRIGYEPSDVVTLGKRLDR